MATEENDRFIILNAQTWIAIHQLSYATATEIIP